ncbi:MAG: glycosyltransferase family 4 protein [Methanobacterium sp.]
MKVLIVTDDYPSAKDYYANEFVHERVAAYAKIDDWGIMVANLKERQKEPFMYVHQGIDVKVMRPDQSKELLDEFQPDIICIHFFKGSLLKWLLPYTKLPIVVWVHGYEALGWWRRLYDLRLPVVKEFLRHIYRNTVQMIRFRKLMRISNENERISFVFVSRWMKEIAEADTLTKAKHFQIIANPINLELFQFRQKDPEMRKKILLIRPFNSRKYANDIAVKAILHLSSHPIFNDLEFEIYGDGRYFDGLAAPLYKFSNVKVNKRFVQHDHLPEVFHQHGIFLCPTRQDSQGVSMCEAMACGLVPLTSHNTAIPEFVQDQHAGFLTRSAAELAERIVYLYENPARFLAMSANAASTMQQLCDKKKIIAREIEYIKAQAERA